MVREWGQCDIDYPAETVWQDVDDEYVGEILFGQLCRQGRFVWGGGTEIWECIEYREQQGTYPVIFLRFADVKETAFQDARKLLNEKEKRFFRNVMAEMGNYVFSSSLKILSNYLYRYYGKKVIIILDEYDTPMQEAYVKGYWRELADLTRSLFNAAFKTNPFLERAVMTGITRGSKESVFSDLNNLEVVTSTSEKYAEVFGFTEEEVSAALEEFGLSEKDKEVKEWYDGFTFGKITDIYNPWSIINYLDKRRAEAYWTNTSANSLVEKLLRESNSDIKQSFERLLAGEMLTMEVDDQLTVKKNSIWSLLLASGYLKVAGAEVSEETGRTYYDLALTNREVRLMFENMT